MNLFTSIFRRKRRPPRPGRRPARSLAMSFASLESRALLTILTPIAPTAAILTPTEMPGPGPSLASSNRLNFGTYPPNGAGGGGHELPEEGAGPGVNGPPFDRQKNHVALSAMPLTVNGVTTTEIALADAGASRVVVNLGGHLQILTAADGINQPQSVLLAYLDNDGTSDAANPYPDLIVTNSGGNNVLIFPGLAGGGFGPAMNGPAGYQVGQNPVAVTLADVNNDGVPDLLVANRGSNSVTMLLGQQGTGPNWSSNSVETIDVGGQGTNTEPIKALYVDSNQDGVGVIVVCNSGSNNVYVYKGVGGGAYDTTDPVIFNVGKDPIDMLVNQFDRHQQLDLVTVNSGSDDLTQIDGAFTATPTTLTVSSGGKSPDAAFAYPIGSAGMMGLVVANGGDGHLAFFQPGISGLQLAGVVTPTDLPIPTGLASGTWSNSGDALTFIAATAGQDAADLLRFDLGVGSTFLPTPVSGSGQSDSELVAGLLPFGESSVGLVAILWAGSPEESTVSDNLLSREPGAITALYSPTEGQAGEIPTPTADFAATDFDPSAGPTAPDQTNQADVNKYVAGDFRKLHDFSEPIEALSRLDVPANDRASVQVVRLDGTDSDAETLLDSESAQGAIEKVLLHLHGLNNREGEADPIHPPGELDPAGRLDGVDASVPQGQTGTVPIVSSAILFSARLILKATPPRPPSFLKRRKTRGVGEKPQGPPTV